MGRRVSESASTVRATNPTEGVEEPTASHGSTPPPRLTGMGPAVGTCGELMQGVTSIGEPFHVTCPVEKRATVRLTVRPASEFAVLPTGPPLAKLERALYETAALLGLVKLEVQVEHRSELEVGKGMGSSTADIVVAARALASAVGRSLSADALGRIATSIESSDGSMHEGMVAFNQKNGHLLKRYAWSPQFVICMVIPAQALGHSGCLVCR